jgi:hypothetical protein
MSLETDSPWQKVVSAAILGTGRQPLTQPTATGTVGKLLSQLNQQSPEAALLTTAATLSLYQRAGWLPEKYPIATKEPFTGNDLPRASPRTVRFLQMMLQGQYPHALPEWLLMAGQFGQRVPELHLPELLDLGKQRRDLRTTILPVLGQRGRWLARQNSEWSYAVEVATEEDWETGSHAARLLYLQDVRSHNPDRARELLQSAWTQEAAVDRAKFLETFRTRLSLTDEPFLEELLADRSKEVRRIAADLLASLPSSCLCQKITAHATRYLRLVKEPKLVLKVELPTALDSTLIDCGIESKPTKQVAANLGEKSWWLLQMIGATPLTTWCNGGMTPAELVTCARTHEWETVLLDGWALAAKRQQNFEWTEALLDTWITGKGSTRTAVLPELSLESLLDGLPPERQNAFLTKFLEFDQGGIDDSLTIWLLRHSHSAWSNDLAQIVLDRLAVHLSQNRTTTNFAWELRTALKEFAHFIPTSLISEAAKLRQQIPSDSSWQQIVEEFLSLLHFRQEMMQAFEGGGEGQEIESKAGR